jgi:sulfite dehydrogenase
MSVKSWINSPIPKTATRLRPGADSGRGLGGMNAVKGWKSPSTAARAWKQARLIGPDMGKYAWRQFVLQAQLPKGTYQLASRATDVKGNVQPETRGENQSGYNNTSWADHAVTVTVA